jgi:hypothetical protein
MERSLLLIVIGIVLAVLVHYGLGIACILIGLVLLLWPRLTTWRTDPHDPSLTGPLRAVHDL